MLESTVNRDDPPFELTLNKDVVSSFCGWTIKLSSESLREDLVPSPSVTASKAVSTPLELSSILNKDL